MKDTRFARGTIIIALLVPALGGAVSVDDPPVGIFADEWYAVMFSGHKSGHMHATMERIKRPGGDVIRTKTDMTLQVGRAGTPVKVGVIQETTETLDGQPVAFSNRTQLGALPSPSVTTGQIKDGKVIVTSSQFGQQAAERTCDLPKGAMMSWAVYREQIKRGLKPGTRYELATYEPSLSPSNITPMILEVLQRETVDLFGRKLEAVKTKQTIAMKNLLGQQTDVDTITWMTDEGTAVRIDMTMLNIPIKVLSCTKSVALSPNDPAELMMDTLIPAEGPVDHQARRITYRLSLKKPSGSARLPDLPETGMQRTVKKAKDAIEVEVTRRSADQPRGHGQALPKDQRQRYLQAAGMVNYKDPVVAQLAKQAAGEEKDPLKLADRLRRFVGDYVQSKNLSVGFASASEVARTRQGDCTEHGVLLAALGRAVGIPTRIVTGVLHTNQFAGRPNVFVGHLWTQFWIDGEWIDLDAAQDQTVVDPAHIALSLSDAGDTGLADLISSVWLTLGNLKIAVLSSE